MTLLLNNVENKPLVSIVICVKDGEKCVGRCLKSLFGQTFQDFEIVIVDDASVDKTGEIIREFNDSRIKYFRNKIWSGIAKSRNIGLKNAIGEYIFNTDADCVASKDWIEEGLKFLSVSGCVGVEGTIYYVSKSYEPTFSDHVMRSKKSGNFMTGNVAYRASVMRAVGGFDEKFTYFEDRDIGLRILKLGKIAFNSRMVIYHPRVRMTPKKYVKFAIFSKNRIYLFKKHGDKECFSGHMYNPGNLMKIFFPPLVFSGLLFNRFESWNDYKLLPVGYIFAAFERLYLWRESFKERVLVI